MNILSIISNTCSVMGLICLCLGLTPLFKTQQKRLFLTGNILLFVASWIAGSLLYTGNALICTIASILAYTRLSKIAKLQVIFITTLALVIFLFSQNELNNNKNLIATVSLIALAIGYASEKNVALTLGGTGIVSFSILNLLESFSLLALVYLILNIFFTFFAFKAVVRKAHG